MHKTYNISTYRIELRQRILETAMKEFKEKGVKSVKMDDISAIIGISKRTLYETYENKEELLLEGLKYDHDRIHTELTQFLQEKERNEIEIMVKFVKIQMDELNKVNPLFFTEVHRYKRVTNYLKEYHAERRKNSMEFISRGVEKGYLIKGLNYDIVIDMGDAVMNHVMYTKLYERYPMHEIFFNYLSVLLRGYCTDKGIAELEKFF